MDRKFYVAKNVPSWMSVPAWGYSIGMYIAIIVKQLLFLNHLTN